MELPKTFNKNFHNEETIKSVRKYYNFLGKTGLEVFKVGLGTGINFGLVDFDETGEPFGEKFNQRVETVRLALSEGINYIDTAPLYAAGKSEKVLGKAIQGLPRESFFLATKIGRNHNCQFDYTPQGVRESFEKSLQNLRVESVDLVTIHDVEFVDDLELMVKNVLPILEQYKREGKIGFIGCSGYPLDPLVKTVQLTSGKLDYVLSYARMTLFNEDLLKCSPLIDNTSLGLINASPLGCGLLTGNVLNDPPVPHWHPCNKQLITACQKAAQLCQNEGVNLPRIAIDYSIRYCPRAALHLVGLDCPEQVANNLTILKDGLTEKELKVQSEVRDIFRSCPETHWEGVEIGRYKSNPKKFTDTLLYGPQD